MKRHIKLTAKLSHDHQTVTISNVELSYYKEKFGHKHKAFGSYGTIFFESSDAILCSYGASDYMSTGLHGGKPFLQFPGKSGSNPTLTISAGQFASFRKAIEEYNRTGGGYDAEASEDKGEAVAGQEKGSR